MSQGKRKREDEGTQTKKVKFADETDYTTKEQKTETVTSKKEAKEIRKQRRLQRPGADILESVKGAWEECRKTSLKPEERKESLDRLFDSLRSHFVEALIKNDGSRIVQTIVKYCTKEQREAIVEELKGHFVELAKNPYGKHIIEKLLQSVPSSRPIIINEFLGKLSSCLRHKHASSVVDTIYSDFCKVAQRNDLMHEFYGKEYVLFKDYSGASIEDILARNVDKKEGILKRLKKAIDSVLSKEATSLMHHSIVHRLIYDYVRMEEPAKLCSWIPSVIDTLVEIVHTLDGAKAVVILSALSSAKERKSLIKSCKPYLQKMIRDEAAHFVVIALCAFVDDTVLIEKTFMAELLSNVPETLSNKHTRQILFSLYAGVNGRHFSKDIVNLFDRAVELSKSSSKKPEGLRRQELCALVTPVLGAHWSLKLKEAIKAPSCSQLLLEMLLSGNSSEIFSRVLTAFKDNIDLLEQEQYRIFLKRFLKRCPLHQVDQVLDSFEPIERLYASDAAYVLAGALDRSESVRSRIASSITRLPSMTNSSRALADLINKLNAGIPLLDH